MSNIYLDQHPAPGTIVWVRAGVIYRHRGIVSDRWHAGKPMVICNSWRLGVVEQTWEEYRDGQIVQVEGYLGHLPYDQVVQRARARLGMAYDLAGFNCDHLVNEAHGLPVESDQVKGTLVLATFACVLLAAAAR